MKAAIFLIVALVASCQADITAEEKILHPNFLFDAAWLAQADLVALQKDINDAIREVVTSISSVAGASAEKALTHYEANMKNVVAVFDHVIGDFYDLPDTDCKNDAEKIITDTTTFTGYEAANCARSYNVAVRDHLDAAQDIVYGFDDIYKQVQLIVSKAFVGFNQFLDGEFIEAKIEEIIGKVTRKWESEKPDLSKIRANLASSIETAYQSNLVACNQNTIDFISTSYVPQFERMVKTCQDFTSPFSFRMAKAAPVSYTEVYEQYLALQEQWKSERGHLL